MSGRVTAQFTLGEGDSNDRRITVPGLARPVVVSLGAAAPQLSHARMDPNVVSVEVPTGASATLVEWREVRSPNPCSNTAGVFTETEKRTGIRVDCAPRSGFWAFTATRRARCDDASSAVELSGRVLRAVSGSPTYVEIDAASAGHRTKLGEPGTPGDGSEPVPADAPAAR